HVLLLYLFRAIVDWSIFLSCIQAFSTLKQTSGFSMFFEVAIPPFPTHTLNDLHTSSEGSSETSADLFFNSSTMVVVLPRVFFASKLTYATQVAFFVKSNFTALPFVMKTCESSLVSTFFAGS